MDSAVRKTIREELLHRLSGGRVMLMGILNVTPDSFSDGGEHFGLTNAIQHAEQMRIDGADIIDIGGEKARLEKTLGKLAKELGGLRGRLNNPKFVASAPDEVVEEAKENLRQREEEESRIKDALARLSEIG